MTRTLSRALITAAISIAAAAIADAQPDAIRYTVRFSAPQTNYLDVEAIVPTDGRPAVEMMMAVWTPGSYLIREYERNVEHVTASAGGRSLAVEKTAKNRWRVTTAGARAFVLAYRVYSHEMTVRSNWVDSDFAMMNGAPTFMTIASDVERVTGAPPRASTVPGQAYVSGRVERPHDVRIELPPGWKTTITGLPAAPDGAPNHYLAPNYDTLVDCPIVAGNPAIHEFTVSGKPHFLADVGEDGVFDGDRAARDLARIVQQEERLWGSLPYDKYVFFNVLTGTGGAIEHKNSVMMMADRWATGTREHYVDWLSTASHEFFHLWNVKRLRPIELGPFDYEHENYPRSLWVSEGLTDYYADVVLARAELISREEYLGRLSSAIKTLQTTPGRLVQTAEMSSFDAWIKQYRPDENSINSSISYYTKGALIGFLLDARIRSVTNGAKSLDDVMRLAYERYSGARGFTPEDFRNTASEVAGTSLASWLHTVLETTEELDYGPALDWYGLAFEAPGKQREASAWLGATTKNDEGRIVVTNVPRGTAAFEGGLNAGDEILAIDDFRVTPDELNARLKAYRPAKKVTVLVARQDVLKRLDVTLGTEPANTWSLMIRRDTTADQQRHLVAWVGDRQ